MECLNGTGMAGNEPTLERLFKGHRGDITSLSFSPDTKKLVSGGADSKLMLWSFSKNTRALSIESHTASVTDVHFSARGNMFASCSKDMSVRLWKPSVKVSCKQFRAHTSAVRSVQISPGSGNLLLTASNDKSVKMWTTDHHNQFLSTFQGHTHWVNCARFSPLGTLIASCSEDKTVKLWDQNSKFCVHTFQEKDGVPKYVEFHPNSKCIGVCFSNNLVKIFDTRSPHKLLQFYNVHSGSVNQIAFHPNGQFMITGSSDKTAKVFDLIEGRLMYTLEGHEGPVTAVTFSSDGHYFATGGADKKILVWKSNFDKEVLAKPLLDDTSVHLEASDIKTEQSNCKVDARKSFSKMEQPDVEVSSVLACSSSDEEKPVHPEQSNGVSSSTVPDTSSCDSGQHNNFTDIKALFSDLKQQVTGMQSQLDNISSRLTSLEGVIGGRKSITEDNIIIS